MSGRRGSAKRRRRWVLGAGACLALLAGLDGWVGSAQQRALEARRALRARLDHLAFHGLRTGIDEIAAQPDGRYEVRFRLQNASGQPLYVMLPAVEAAVQVGARWKPLPVAEPAGISEDGTVVKLTGERTAARIVTAQERDYMELIPGHMHLRLTLEALVSPQENPLEEIGERREDMFVYLRDRQRGEPPPGAPSFIPLRAWTLIPEPVR